MTTTTLRAFLQAHEDDRFLWRGEVVTCQRLTDHYSSYLEAAVEAESDDVWFSSVGQRSHLPAFTVLPPSPLKVLVCGGRDYADEPAIRRRLSNLPAGTIIVHGGARGADALAGINGKQLGFEVRCYPADWQRHGRAAGVRRNEEMLSAEAPDLVIAFPGGRGTAHMVRIAAAAGVKVEKCMKEVL